MHEASLFVYQAYSEFTNPPQGHTHNINQNHSTSNHELKVKETQQLSLANSSDCRLNILNQVNPWTLIQALKVVEAEDFVETEKKRLLAKQQLMCSNLNEQLRLKELTSNLEKLELSELKAKQEQELMLWKQEQENSLRKKEQKLSELHRIRQLQLDERNNQKQRDIEAERIRSSLEIDEIRSSLQREEDDKRRRKEQESERWKDIINENIQRAAEKSRLASEEAEAENRLMAEMRVKLDREQEVRSDLMRNRYHRVEDLARLVSESAIRVKENDEKKREYEILRQVHEKEKAEAEKQKAQSEAKERMQRLINESNMLIIREKKARQDKLEIEAEKYAARCRKENEETMAEKAQTLRKELEIKKSFKEMLDKQIQDRETKIGDTQGMTTVERSINKKVTIKNKLSGHTAAENILNLGSPSFLLINVDL
jgi:hypothetical protein